MKRNGALRSKKQSLSILSNWALQVPEIVLRESISALLTVDEIETERKLLFVSQLQEALKLSLQRRNLEFGLFGFKRRGGELRFSFFLLQFPQPWDKILYCEREVKTQFEIRLEADTDY